MWNVLPDAKDIPRLPRSWLLSAIFTVVGKPFADWVDSRVTERNKARVVEKNMMIDLDPEVAKAFHESTHVSLR